MDTREKIQKKKEQLRKVTEKLKKDIENLEWQCLEEEYNLKKGNVCTKSNSDKYMVLDEIGGIFGEQISLHFSIIKKDGEIGKNTTWDYARDVKKEFDSYEDYKKALMEL